MPHITNFGNNNTQNGWLYKNLEDKMAELDQQIIEIKNLIESSNNSLLDYANLINDISNKASITFVKNHIDDSVRHITDVERTRWNKYIGGLKLNLNLKGVVYDYSELPAENNEAGDAYHIADKYGENSGMIYIWNSMEWVKLGNIINV